MKKVLAVLDWNGTILADSRIIHGTVNYILGQYRLKPVSYTNFRRFMTIPVSDFYIWAGMEKEVALKELPNINRLFQHFYAKNSQQTRTRRGSKELLAWFREKKDIEVVILTNHFDFDVTAHLNRLGLTQYVDHLMAINMNISVNARKGEKLKLFLEFKEYEYSFMIGDGPEEIDIAKDLGLKSIAITDGVYHTNRIAHADHVADTMHSVKTIIEQVIV